jgi:hypothetical protein
LLTLVARKGQEKGKAQPDYFGRPMRALYP